MTKRIFLKFRVHDGCSRTAHCLQAQLTPAQEIVVVDIRRALHLPLDQSPAVTCEFIGCMASNSGVERRHGVGNLNILKPAEPKEAHKAFKNNVPVNWRRDVNYLPQIQNETKRRKFFVAVGRSTFGAFLKVKPPNNPMGAKAFLRALHNAYPINKTGL